MISYLTSSAYGEAEILFAIRFSCFIIDIIWQTPEDRISSRTCRIRFCIKEYSNRCLADFVHRRRLYAIAYSADTILSRTCSFWSAVERKPEGAEPQRESLLSNSSGEGSRLLREFLALHRKSTGSGNW